AMRVVVEEKRVNSLASAKPQAKLPEQLVWAKVPGSTNQYGPIPRSMLEAAEGGGKASKGTSGGGAGSPGLAAASPRMTPRASAAPSPRGSAAGSPPPPLAAAAAAARLPSGHTAGNASAAAVSAAASEDNYDLSGEVGSYEPSGVPSLRPAAAPSLHGSRSGGGLSFSTPRSGNGVGGRSDKRYVADSVTDEDGMPEEASIPDEVDVGDEF
ncbi:hypothetical protein Vafri_22084, partial [Volvox africanus]